MPHVSGPFDVKVIPQKPDNPQAEGAQIGRMSLDKQFHGALEAVSKGEMLAAHDPAKGSGGCVALERLTGKLDGKSGSFALQHSSFMRRGVPEQSITVVPDSGTGELEGITGKMVIRIEGKAHFYEFDYELG
ncbi:MAG TPA: DUF3224 domain-containing protein [Candidatus Koribacter sp.]|jgi:hypothetical protein